MQVGTFSIIKASVPIIEAAERYGMEIDRNEKALCCFHNDTHKSMSFKNERFTCFSCDKKGDIFDIVSQLLNISNTEAAARLNIDFGLHLDIDKPPQTADISRVRREKALAKAFTFWELSAFISVCAWYKVLVFLMKTFKPKDPEKPLPAVWCYAADRIGKVEYFLDRLTLGTHDEKLKFYEDYRIEVKQIEEYIG
jgi:hypothetical protein